VREKIAEIIAYPNPVIVVGSEWEVEFR